MWKHIVIDNFFEESDFSVLLKGITDNLKNAVDSVKPEELVVLSSTIYSNGVVDTEVFDKVHLLSLHKKYHPIMLAMFEKLCPERVHLYDYSMFHVTITGKDYKYPWHTDALSKIFSGIIYMHPQMNKGTVLSDIQKGPEHEIPWKPNRGLFFAQKEDVTWHYYEGDGINTRVVIVYNLCTKQNYTDHDAIRTQRRRSLSYKR